MLLLSCVLHHKETPLNTLHDDGTTLEVGVAGPGAVKAWAVAVRRHVKISHLFQLGVLILDVVYVQDSQPSAIVGFVGEITPG